MAFTHSYHRRALYHDYKAPTIYHITIIKRPQMPVFSYLTGDWRIKYGNPGCVGVI